jgi:chromate transporter
MFASEMKISTNKYLKEVALLFLKIGATAFGGPAAYIAIMQQEMACYTSIA